LEDISTINCLAPLLLHLQQFIGKFVEEHFYLVDEESVNRIRFIISIDDMIKRRWLRIEKKLCWQRMQF